MILREDIPGFLYDASREDPERYLTLHFEMECSGDPQWVAANLCSEQSTAQWNIPGESGDWRPRHAAKIVSLEILEKTRTPLYPLPSTQGEKDFLRCRVVIAHPHENFGPRLANLLAAVAGEGIFYAPGVHTIRLTDILFPQSYLKEFEGPQFGLSELRKMFGIEERPFFIGVVKPNLGLTPEKFAPLAEQAWLGGLDIAKDDEMLADTTWSPTRERIRLIGEARKRAMQATRRPKGFIVNVSDEIDAMPALLKDATRLGANLGMINPALTGLPAIRLLRKTSEIPLMGHFAGIAAWGRLPYFGVSSVVLTKLMRLAGCDLIGIAGFGARMQSTDEEVLANVRACLEPMGNIRHSLPIPGGSDTAKTLPDVFRKVGHTDFGFISGRGVFGYPGGPAAGAKSLIDAWEKLRSR